MAGENEELNTVDDETTEVIEDQDTDDVSPEDDDLGPSDDTEVTDDTSDEPSPDTDDVLDEADFIKQYDLPEDVTTVEDALEYAKNLKDGLLPELKRGQTQAETDLAAADAALKQLGFANGVRDVLEGRGVPPAQPTGTETNWEQQFYVVPKIQERVNKGELSADDAQVFTPIMQDVDASMKRVINVMAGMYEHFNATLNPLQTGFKSITSMQKDSAYGSYSQKNKGKAIPKEKLDKVLADVPKWGNDYQKAHNFMLVEDNKTFSNLVSNIEKGTLKKFNRKGRRFMKGSGLAQTKSLDVNKYVLPDGTMNQVELDKLDVKTQEKVLDQIIKKGG